MRSSSQGSLYFAAIVEPLVTFYEQNPDKLFTDMYKVLRGEHGKDMVHFINKMLFNKGRSTKMDKGEFSDFVERVREFHRDNNNLDLRSIHDAPII